MRRGLIGLAGLFLFAAGSVRALPPVWIAQGAHARVVIFGSVHLLPADLDWHPPVLMEALANADNLWFELQLNQATDREAASLWKSRGSLPAADSLALHLTPGQNQRLSQAAIQLGLAREQLDRMRPWMAELMLSLVQDRRSGALASHGVEQELQNLAGDKPRRRAFETVAQQVSFLADASPADQAASLDETLTDILDRPDAYKQIVRDWMNGDLKAMQADALDPLSQVAPKMFQHLITDRNRRWARTIRQMLAARGQSVVVVGAAHLLGPDGVVQLLRNAGVVVDGPLTVDEPASHLPTTNQSTRNSMNAPTNKPN